MNFNFNFSFNKSSKISLSRIILNSHLERIALEGGIIEDYDASNDYIKTILDIYSITSEEEFKSKIPVSLNPSIFGYKLGNGSGLTAGQSVQKLYSINQAYDVEQLTAANQPLILRHTADNYYFNPRISGNSCRTTDKLITTYNSATDTLRFTAKIFLNNQTTTSFDYLSSIGSAGNFAIANKGSAKQLRFRGTANAADSTQYTPSTTQPHWVRYTVSTTIVTYEWSEDGINWTTIGTPSRPTVGTLSSTFTICDTALTQSNITSVYYAKFENITTGTACTFTPNLYIRSNSENFWQDVDCSWTVITSSSNSGLKSVMVDESYLIGDGVMYFMSNLSATLNQPYTSYVSLKRLGTGVVYGLAASSQLSNDATNMILNNGSPISISNTDQKKQLVTSVSDGISSSIQINNDTATNGDAGANDGTYLEILKNGISYGNYFFNSLLIINGN